MAVTAYRIPTVAAQLVMARIVWLLPVPPAPVKNIDLPVFTASSAAACSLFRTLIVLGCLGRGIRLTFGLKSITPIDEPVFLYCLLVSCYAVSIYSVWMFASETFFNISYPCRQY